jgi:hypothetical protein
MIHIYIYNNIYQVLLIYNESEYESSEYDIDKYVVL